MFFKVHRRVADVMLTSDNWQEHGEKEAARDAARIEGSLFESKYSSM